MRDRYERKHRRTARHPECVRHHADANFDGPTLSAAMGLEPEGQAVTHTGHAVRHIRCGRPVHYRAFRDGPTHALTTTDHMVYLGLCGAVVRIGSGEAPNVLPTTDRGAEQVTCGVCLLALPKKSK